MKRPAAPFPHLLIRASAGTGKTFQLSNRFLALAAAGEPIDTILAATFTRKAAGEILDRVLYRLAEASVDDGHAARLARELAVDTLDRARCGELLCGMLRRLHRLRVGTLDSFFMQIARSFSLELGLPPGWRIVDEIVDVRWRAEAVRAVLRNESTADVLRLVHLLTKGEAARSVSQQINELVGDLHELYLEAPAEAWHALPRHKELSAEELEQAVASLAAAPLPGDKRFVSARDEAVALAQLGDWETLVCKGLGAKVVAEENRFYNKPIPPEILEPVGLLVRHARAVLVRQIAQQTEATRQLLERFDRAYQACKLSERGLRFADVTRTVAVAGLGERMDEIVYRLDARIRHLLLDEFQDTSPLQWCVLRPIARHVVDAAPGPSFFCVGDVKQAIYGWRGGVAEIFEAVADDLGKLQAQALDRSWRSSPPVIEVVNRVFGRIGSNAALGRYAGAAGRWAGRFEQHTTARTELSGCGCLRTAPRPADAQSGAEAVLTFAAGEVERLHRRAPGCTIGVLVRRNAAVARLIYELRQRGLEASEEGGNPLTDSPAVQLMLSLLKLADHPGDTAARFHVAHSPLAEHVGLRWADRASAWQLSLELRRRLMEQGYGPCLYGWAERLAGTCDRRDLNRLMQLVELAYGYAPTARVDDFLDLVARRKVEDPSAARLRVMTIHQAKGLQFDIVVLPELGARVCGQPGRLAIGRPGPAQAITHVCRHVNTALQRLLPQRFQEIFQAQQDQMVEEALCVLYVAMTRAIHALHMIIAPSAENERTIPATFAGVLRAALGDGSPVPPDRLLFEQGDPEWERALPAAVPEPPVTPEPAAEGSLRLAPPSQRLARGLERLTPSGLEAGARVSLAQELRLESHAARGRGSLLHAWFEQIGWLEDGPPDDAALARIAAQQGYREADAAALLARFHQSLSGPTVCTVLSRSTYQRGAADLPAWAGQAAKDPRWEVWRERPFAVIEEDAILTGKIDRLIVLYDGDRPVAADVIDFKSDALPPGDAAALRARAAYYRPQLEAYRRAVAQMLGLPAERVSARLLFTELDAVVAV